MHQLTLKKQGFLQLAALPNDMDNREQWREIVNAVRQAIRYDDDDDD